MPRLVDFHAAPIEFGLDLDAAIAAGSAPQSVAQAQQGARRLLEQARAAALAAGKPAHEVESASFALVAWLDEIVARHPAWNNGTRSLQMLLFNSSNADTEFFHHLSALQPHQGELREVYWHALVHGFAGQYYFERGDTGELGKLKALHGQQLPVAPLALETLARDRITPQPYGAPDAGGPRAPQRRERAVLRSAAVLALLLPAGWLLWQLWSGAPAAGSPLAQRVEQQLQRYPCADLSASVSGSGATQVSGFVAQPDDMARVEREVAALPGVSLPRFDLQLRGWPHCEVVSILKPYRARQRDKQASLTVTAGNARQGRLREGEHVQLQASNARPDGHLWLDYFTADGMVFHFQAGPGLARAGGGERIELGQNVPSGWLVRPPFGMVLITALSSPVAWREGAERPPFELASDYLPRLRQALAGHKGSDGLVADFAFFETEAR